MATQFTRTLGSLFPWSFIVLTLKPPTALLCHIAVALSSVYCADTTISSSDQRDKTDVTDFTHGLDFVTKLNPKTYKWDKRSWYLTDDNQSILDVKPDGTHKKDRVNIGFMAQHKILLQ